MKNNSNSGIEKALSDAQERMNAESDSDLITFVHASQNPAIYLASELAGQVTTQDAYSIAMIFLRKLAARNSSESIAQQIQKHIDAYNRVGGRKGDA